MSVHDSTDAGENTVAGIAWMLATIFWFVALDATAKYLLQSYPVIQVVWARFFFHLLIVIALMYRSLRYQWRSANLPRQAARSVLMFATNVLFFLGIASMPLTLATTIMFLSPIMVSVLAIPMLGESMGIRRWIGVLVGFIGAVIVVQPTTTGWSFGAVFLLASALTNALYQIVTRQLRDVDSQLTSLFYTGLTGALLTTAVVPFVWVRPDFFGWILMMSLGAFGCVGHWCLIRALRKAEASVVVPFSYTSLIWASVFGFVLFDDRPNASTLIGAGIIILSGFYIFRREQQARN